MTVDDARVNLFARSVTLRGIRLKPDTLQGESPNPEEIQLDVSVEGVYASGFNLKMIRGKVPFKLKTLEIDRPLISADIYSGAKTDTTSAEDAAETGKKPFDLPTRRLVITDGNVILRQHTATGQTYTEADDINIDIRQGNGTQQTETVLGSLEGSGTVSAVVMTNADASVDTVIDSLRIDLGAGRVSIAGATVTPRYSKEQFVYKTSRHRDWTHLWVRDVEIYGLDVSPAGAFAREGKTTRVSVDSIHVGSGLVESYKDRNASQPYWVRKLIFESVWELPVLLTVGKAVIGNMGAVYTELPKGGTAAGTIDFSHLSGTITGLSNIPSPQEPYWTLAAHASLYGAAPLNATFYFPKDETTDRFEIAGSLGRLDMRSLNKTVIPLAKAEVETGTIDKMTFHIVGNRRTATVDMELLYHDLKIDLIKYKADHEVKERKLLSWIANTFVVKDSNPEHGQTRRGGGSAEREPDRSQFNFLWRTLLEGIKETAGL